MRAGRHRGGRPVREMSFPRERMFGFQHGACSELGVSRTSGCRSALRRACFGNVPFRGSSRFLALAWAAIHVSGISAGRPGNLVRARQRECEVDLNRAGNPDCPEELTDAILAARVPAGPRRGQAAHRLAAVRSACLRRAERQVVPPCHPLAFLPAGSPPRIARGGPSVRKAFHAVPRGSAGRNKGSGADMDDGPPTVQSAARLRCRRDARSASGRQPA